MTENEAKEVLEEKYLTMSMCGDIEWCKRNNQAISKSIKALEEIQQYRSIGTVSECREAMEKQRAKKYERGLDKEVRCPICGTFTTDIYEHRFCSYCGQRLE